MEKSHSSNSSANPQSKIQPAQSTNRKSTTAKSNATQSATDRSAAAISDDAVTLLTAERREGEQGPNRRESVIDRRVGMDRRHEANQESNYDGPERRATDERREDSGLERRRGPGRRRSDDRKSAEEGEMTGEQFEFCMAIQMYKKVNKKMYPTWTEVLEVVRQLGYRKVEHRNINLPNVPEPELTKAKVA